MSVLRTFRVAEAALVTGFVAVGAVFAPVPSAVSVRAGLVFAAGAYLLIFSIYAFNSWAGFEHDRDNVRLALDGRVGRTGFAAACALSSVMGIGICAANGGLVGGMIAVSVFGLWAAYSWPRRGLKYIPLAGTGLHVAVGAAQFLLGYTAFGGAIGRGLALGLYFGLIFASGHVNHELIDREADERAGIASGAVKLGERAMGRIFAALALASLVWLAMLVGAGTAEPRQAAPFFAAGVVQLLGVVGAVRRDPSVRWYVNRNIYRAAYAAAGVAAALAA